MKFYHGTTEEAWSAIQQEGVLWGVRPAVTLTDGIEINPCRCTYLSIDSAEEAAQYGPVVLEVEYSPGSLKDNWARGAWQLRVYDPIPISKVRKVQ